MKLAYFIQIYKNVFRMLDHTKDSKHIMSYAWKRLRKCIFTCVSWFVSIILNFNALCDAYTVQRQNYIMLLKSNIIFRLILGITFENYSLSVSKEGDDHLCFYFVFLNYPPMLLNFFIQAHSNNLNSYLISNGQC